MKKLYLIDNHNGTYKAEIGDDRVAMFGVEVTNECAYPVPIWFKSNQEWNKGKIVFMVADDQEDLIEKLNKAGQDGDELIKIWKYDSIGTPSQELASLFEHCKGVNFGEKERCC